MAPANQAHPAVEALELYAMGRLHGTEEERVEEHLLVCRDCQKSLDDSDEYVGLLREALQGEANLVPEGKLRKWWDLDWLSVPVPALGAAMAIFALLLVWNHQGPAALPGWQTVDLQTQRGDGNSGAAPAGYRLEIRLDASGLPSGPASAAIVDARGGLHAETTVVIEEGKATMRCENILPEGQYWIRLRIGGETEREYSLSVKRR